LPGVRAHRVCPLPQPRPPASNARFADAGNEATPCDSLPGLNSCDRSTNASWPRSSVLPRARGQRMRPVWSIQRGDRIYPNTRHYFIPAAIDASIIHDVNQTKSHAAEDTAPCLAAVHRNIGSVDPHGAWRE
jgi:hypothetical protein